MSDQKVQVKIGNAEFSAEGEQGVVQAQFEKFLEALQALGTGAVSGATAGGGPAVSAERGNGEPGIGPDLEDLVKRVFADEARGLSLRVLPTGERAEGEALLLLLFGFFKLRGEANVLAGTLMTAARQSGVVIRRIDATLLQREFKDLVTQSGRKSGRRYGLNNRGIARAEELLGGILQ
jgi:hypothetical protein